MFAYLLAWMNFPVSGFGKNKAFYSVSYSHQCEKIHKVIVPAINPSHEKCGVLLKSCDSYWFPPARYFSKQRVLKDSQRCCLQKRLHGYFQGKNIYSMWKGFLPRALLLVSAKEKRKAPRKFVSQYELTLGSTQMQFLAELIYVHQIPQDRSQRGCYWQIGHIAGWLQRCIYPCRKGSCLKENGYTLDLFFIFLWMHAVKIGLSLKTGLSLSIDYLYLCTFRRQQ